MKKNIAIGAFIGGSHIACAAIDIEKKVIIPDSYFKGLVESNSSAGLILTLWSTYLKKSISVVGKENIIGIACSMPGPFDYANGIAIFEGVPKYEGLKGMNISNEFRKRLNLDEHIKIRFINDAIGFALGENWTGRAKGFSSSIAIMIGDGFGSAFLKNGVPVIDSNTVPPKGTVYNIPFEDGIADDYFSSRGILNSYKKNGGAEFKKVNSLVNLPGDKKVQQVFNDFGYRLAEFLMPIFKKFQAEVCVFGGKISEHFNLFGVTFKKYLAENNYSITIEISELGDHSFILGAARLLVDEHWTRLEPIISKLK